MAEHKTRVVSVRGKRHRWRYRAICSCGWEAGLSYGYEKLAQDDADDHLIAVDFDG